MAVNSSSGKRSQAAIEFLASYGWAFLVILIVIGALSYFGVLSPSKLLPDRCNFGAELSCVDYSIASNGIELKLRNNAGSKIIVDSFALSTENAQISCDSNIIGRIWDAGEVKIIPIGCDFANSGIIAGDKGKINVKITYHSAKSSAAFGKELQGELYATAQPGAHNFIQWSTSVAGFWSFDEGFGTQAGDSSSNANAVKLFNGAAWVAGKKGSAISFDGIDDFAEIPDSPSLDITSQITITAWVYPRGLTAAADQDMILNKEGIPYEIALHDNTGPDDGIHSCGKSTDLIPAYNFAFYFGGLSGLPSHNCGWKDGGGPLSLNQWTHVAVTYDGLAVRTYINGVMRKEYIGVSGTIQLNDNAIRIGARGMVNPPPQTNGGALFNGIVDEVKVFNRALSAQEMFIDYST